MFVFEDHSEEIKQKTEAAIMRALEIIGGKAEEYAAGLAPIDTGNLRNSITHTHPQKDSDGLYTIVGTNVEYAPYQEFGTSKMKAANHGQGYLRPGINNHMDEFKAILNDELSTI